MWNNAALCAAGGFEAVHGVLSRPHLNQMLLHLIQTSLAKKDIEGELVIDMRLGARNRIHKQAERLRCVANMDY